MAREQKITLGEMRQSGPRRLLVYCGDYKCAPSAWSTPIAGAMRFARQTLSKLTCKGCRSPRRRPT